MANFKQGFWYMSEKDIYIGKNTVTNQLVRSTEFKKGQPYLCPKDNYLISSHGELLKVNARHLQFWNNGINPLNEVNEHDTIKLYQKYLKQPNTKIWMYKLYAIYKRIMKKQHLHEELKNILNKESNFNIYNN